MASGGVVLVTLIDDWALAVAPAASVTVTVKLNVPVVVGLPVMTPLELSETPGGSDPPDRVQVKGGVPPFAASVTCTCPLTPVSGSVNGGIVSGGLIRMVRVAAPELPAKSLVEIVKVNTPACVGVPWSMPLMVSDSPGGRLPPEILHVSELVWTSVVN